jgi:hypothetical protein
MVRKPPIWRRRWVWAVIGLAALGGILAGVLIALHNRSARDFKARQVAVIQQYEGKLASKFPTDNQLIPPDAIAFYPSLTQDLQKLATGKLTPSDAITKAKQVQSSAQAASTAIGSLNLTQLIPADLSVTGLPAGPTSSTGQSSGDIEAPGATRPILQDSQLLMREAFALWSQAGTMMEQAAKAAPIDRKAFADQATQIANEAGSLFDQGYRKLLAIVNALGLQPPTPPAQVQPSPTASPTPSASVKPTPSHKPSATPSR